MAFPIPGWRGEVPLHWGSEAGAADLFAPRGTPVVAPVGGQVVAVGSSGPGGNNVLIRAADGLLFYLAHLDQVFTQVGQTLTEGQQIGTVGDSGNAATTGPHLHIGIGREIAEGTGPRGGAGVGFDAVGWLRKALGSGTASSGSTATRPTTSSAPTSSGPAPIRIPAFPSFLNPLGPLIEFTTWLGQPNIWRRFGLIILGVLIALIGMIMFVVSFIDRRQVAQVGKMVAAAA